MTPAFANEFQKPFNATDGDTRSLTPNANNANWRAATHHDQRKKARDGC
jgi:hypothetical protein